MTETLPFKTQMVFEYEVASEMSAGVARVVCNNPGPFTFRGTNTYLVGTRALTVVDPGPDDARHRSAILRAAAGRPITHIAITHTHRDHVDGLSALKAATGAKTAGFGRAERLDATTTDATPSGSEFVAYGFRPDVVLGHGDRLEGGDHALVALHTPGHAPDHLCFAVETGGGAPEALISGDHVMAWNTSVVAPPEGRMADYLASLDLLVGRGERVYLPGHGGRLEEPQRMVKAYLLHRRWREQSILAAIRDGADTIRTIVPRVYPEIESRLLTAATLSVQAHVDHLSEKGLVSWRDPDPSASPWDRGLFLSRV